MWLLHCLWAVLGFLWGKGNGFGGGEGVKKGLVSFVRLLRRFQYSVVVVVVETTQLPRHHVCIGGMYLGRKGRRGTPI